MINQKKPLFQKFFARLFFKKAASPRTIAPRAPAPRTNELRGNLILCLTAFIWGTAFVAQAMGMELVGPFTFNSIRSVIGGLALLACVFLFDRIGVSKKPASRAEYIFLAKSGLTCGLILFVASSLQQLGIKYSTAGKAGFLTALYIIIIPVIGIFMKKRASANIWGAVAVALAGMYFLCVKETFKPTPGDVLLIGCAFCYSLHIIAIDYFAPRTDCVRMSCIQLLVSGAIGLVFMFIFEEPTLASIYDARLSILYAGLLSSAAAYTLQIVAQRDTKPVMASLIMSLESVFAVLAGWVVLNEVLTLKELFGCALILVAIIWAQIPKKGRKTQAE